MNWIKITVLISAILHLHRIDASSTGAPIQSCGDMLPQHPPFTPQLATPPIEVIASSFIQSGDAIQVIIRGVNNFQFRGFFIQARNTDDNVPIGRFSPSTDVNIVNCFGMIQSAATHTNNLLKSEVVMEWEAPAIINAITFEFQ